VCFQNLSHRNPEVSELLRMASDAEEVWKIAMKEGNLEVIRQMSRKRLLDELDEVKPVESSESHDLPLGWILCTSLCMFLWLS
jgi:hypothetical protein